MLFMAAGSIGTLVTIQFWGRFADHSGSGRAMFKGLVGHSLAALLCFTLLPGANWTPYVLVVVVVFAYIFAAAYAMAANRALLLYVGISSRMGYTNAWLVATSVAFGLTPILAGFLIDRLGLAGFRICFGISGVLGLVCAVACRLLVHGGKPLDKSIAQLLNPVLPIRLLTRIMWITVGLHESSRSQQTDRVWK
jgi:MFS family permease